MTISKKTTAKGIAGAVALVATTVISLLAIKKKKDMKTYEDSKSLE